jgi:hypothetical protein
VRDEDKVVDLTAIPDYRILDRAPSNRAVAADLDIVPDDDRAKVGNADDVTILILLHAKALLPDHGMTLD